MKNTKLKVNYNLTLYLIYVVGLQPPNQNQRLWSYSARLPHTGHRRLLLGVEANVQVPED